MGRHKRRPKRQASGQKTTNKCKVTLAPGHPETPPFGCLLYVQSSGSIRGGSPAPLDFDEDLQGRYLDTSKYRV